MKFFIDTADVNEIREAHALGLVDGVTTNPSLIAKSGRKFKDVIKEIVSIVDGPISAEVISLDAPGMIKEGKELAKIHKNIVVKLPMTPEGLKASRLLVIGTGKVEELKDSDLLKFGGVLAGKIRAGIDAVTVVAELPSGAMVPE